MAPRQNHSHKVLLLNAAYEPLYIVSEAKALALVWRQAAIILETNEGRVLKSTSFQFPSPSVVRLVAYDKAHQHGRNQGTSRLRILTRDQFRCQYCGRRGTHFELTLDHIFPRSRGGRTAADNLVAACQPCNQRKANRTPDEARMPLLSHPSALHYGLERVTMLRMAEARPKWRKYLFLEEATAAVA